MKIVFLSIANVFQPSKTDKFPFQALGFVLLKQFMGNEYETYDSGDWLQLIE